MTLSSLLRTLTHEERDFITRLDYGQDCEQHYVALEKVIAADGLVDFDILGNWYPYEVIELCANSLQSGHEREYAACLGIVLQNFASSNDIPIEVELIIDNQSESISRLPNELKAMVTALVERIIA